MPQPANVESPPTHPAYTLDAQRSTLHAQRSNDHLAESAIWLVWPDLTRRFVWMTDTAAVFGPAGFSSTESFASPGGTLSNRKLPRLSARVRLANARTGASRFVAVEEFSTITN